MLFLNHCFSLGKCSCHIQLSFGGNQVGWSCFNSTKVNWSWMSKHPLLDCLYYVDNDSLLDWNAQQTEDKYNRKQGKDLAHKTIHNEWNSKDHYLEVNYGTKLCTKHLSILLLYCCLSKNTQLSVMTILLAGSFV